MELKRSRKASSETVRSLLIVPYGIETAEQIGGGCGANLLIVPYGIETE